MSVRIVDVREVTKPIGLGGNESYPDLFPPYGGFPESVRVQQGYITMPDLTGTGSKGKADLYAKIRRLAE